MVPPWILTLCLLTICIPPILFRFSSNNSKTFRSSSSVYCSLDGNTLPSYPPGYFHSACTLTSYFNSLASILKKFNGFVIFDSYSRFNSSIDIDQLIQSTSFDFAIQIPRNSNGYIVFTQLAHEFNLLGYSMYYQYGFGQIGSSIAFKPAGGIFDILHLCPHSSGFSDNTLSIIHNFERMIWVHIISASHDHQYWKFSKYIQSTQYSATQINLEIPFRNLESGLVPFPIPFQNFDGPKSEFGLSLFFCKFANFSVWNSQIEGKTRFNSSKPPFGIYYDSLHHFWRPIALDVAYPTLTSNLVHMCFPNS